MLIYAGSISNLTDARYFAAWNIQWMGYNFDQSTDSPLSKEAFHAIAEWVEGPERVFEAGIDNPTNLELMCKETKCCILKLHPLQDLDHAFEGEHSAIKTIRHYVFENESLSADLLGGPASSYLLFDFHKNGIDPRNVVGVNPLMKNLEQSGTKIIIAWPLNIPFDKNWVDLVDPFGLYLAGGPEEKVGVKSYEVLDEILEEYSGF